jgi:hypothetical protein
MGWWIHEGDAFDRRLVIGATFVRGFWALARMRDEGTPMGKSFFTGTDAELRSGTVVFATKIALTPTAYGLSAPQAASYGTLSSAYCDAYDEIQDPSTRTKPKVAAKNTARDAVCAMAADLANIVEGTPTVSDEQKLDLGLSVRATPTPIAAPGTPYKFEVKLAGNGWLELGWKCNNPAGSTGTMYMIWRKIGSGEFTFVGDAGGCGVHRSAAGFAQQGDGVDADG